AAVTSAGCNTTVSPASWAAARGARTARAAAATTVPASALRTSDRGPRRDGRSGSAGSECFMDSLLSAVVRVGWSGVGDDGERQAAIEQGRTDRGDRLGPGGAADVLTHVLDELAERHDVVAVAVGGAVQALEQEVGEDAVVVPACVLLRQLRCLAGGEDGEAAAGVLHLGQEG